MFFAGFDKNLTAKENRYGLADSTMNGSVRFSLFSKVICFVVKG